MPLDANTIIANAPDPVFVSDLQGKILQANQAVSELLGLRPNELLEQSLARFVVAQEAEEFMAALREVVQRGVSRNVLLNPLSADGEVIPTSLNASALRHADGRVVGAIGILRDMRELNKARAYAESLIKHAPDPVFVSNLEGKILQANDAVYALLGFRTDQVVEQSLSRFISAAETREFMAALREVVERGVTRNARLTPRSASGAIIPTTLNASALCDGEGRVIGAIGILRDMRAYEQAVRDLEESRRQLGEANQAKDRFLATLSHELRTPLTAMLGWVRLLRGGTLDGAASTRALDVVERNTKLLAQLIEDLLDVSRIITGKLRLEMRLVDPVAVVESALESIQGLAEAKAISLRATLESAAGPVSGDPDRLQQVVWNLLSNAIKFTPAGGSVEVRLEPVASYARITVADTGKGIEPELLPHVFDHFRQGESGTEHTQGLGLGLAIVRHFVELHGGTVRAHSGGVGHGATFTVDLPVPVATASQTQAAEPPWKLETRPLPSPIRLDGVRVLVVDDEPDARDLLTAVLEQRGADVMAVASVAEALQALERSAHDVLVSDIGLPGDDGYALIRAVRRRERSRGGHLPAVAVTAYARVEDRTRALAAGFQVHVAKPVDPAEFAAIIADVARNGQRRPAV